MLRLRTMSRSVYALTTAFLSRPIAVVQTSFLVCTSPIPDSMLIIIKVRSPLLTILSNPVWTSNVIWPCFLGINFSKQFLKSAFNKPLVRVYIAALCKRSVQTGFGNKNTNLEESRYAPERNKLENTEYLNVRVLVRVGSCCNGIWHSNWDKLWVLSSEKPLIRK